MQHEPRLSFYDGYGLFGTGEEVHRWRDWREGWQCTLRLRRQTKQKRLGLAMFWVRMGKQPSNKKPAFPIGNHHGRCLERQALCFFV